MDFLIVGLGNPGKKYENTRHNAGFLAIDKVAKQHNVCIDRLKFNSLFADVLINSKKCLLVKPQTFMNLSGNAVADFANFYKIPPENIIILVDDISLDVGSMRIRVKGSHGGQNGLRNISERLSTDNYPRVKIGVGKKPHSDYDLADWVLSNFTKNDVLEIEKVTDNCVNAIELMVSGDTQKAVGNFN